MKKRLILSSVCSILLCLCLITGATFALFTSESKVNVAVTTGKVDVTAEVDNFKVYSGKWNETTGLYDSELQDGLTFATSGQVLVEGNEIQITGMVPMDKLTFDIVIKNNSNVDAKYQTIFTLNGSEGDVNLLDVLEITIEEPSNTLTNVKVGNDVISNWVNLAPRTEGEDTSVTVLNVTIYLPESAGNEYQDLVANFTYCVTAIQQNAHTVDPVPADKTEDKTVYIYTVQDFKEFAESVNNGNTYARKTVKLMASLDLNNEEWTPIGNSTTPFKGVFDGNAQTISNLKVTANPKMSNVGLFGVTEDGEIRNLTVQNAEVKGRLNVGVVAGTPYTSKYTNINVIGDIKVDGMAYVGGVGGKNAYANWTNVSIVANEGSYVNANSVENGSAYRTYVGGVIGFAGEGSHKFENITSNIDVIGSTVDAGGIIGIAHYGNIFVNCVSTGNVTLTDPEELSDALQIGGIAGVWHNETGYTVTLTNCEFKGQLYATLQDGTVVETFENKNLVGSAYSANGKGLLVIDGYKYEKISEGFYKALNSDNTVSHYEISNAEGLKYFGENYHNSVSTYSRATIKLTADINLENYNWSPIGNSSQTLFYGTFDGQGHTISNLTAINDLGYGNGFFGNLGNNVVVKNITFKGAYVSRDTEGNFSGNAYGIVAGYVYGSALFENVNIIDSYVRGFGKVAAILGMNGDPGSHVTKFVNCNVVNTTIAGIYNVANLVGLTQAGNIIDVENCVAEGTWEVSKTQTYVTFNGEVATEATSGDQINVYGNYWKYVSGTQVFYYTGWAKYYSTYDYAAYDYCFEDGSHLAHGVCVDR